MNGGKSACINFIGGAVALNPWKKTQGAVAFCIIMVLILDSKSAVAGAAEGIQLCMQQVIPAIFPILVLSVWLTSTMENAEFVILRPLGRLLRIPRYAVSLLLPAFFGGYPVGAQCTAEAYRLGRISKETGEKMLSFCSNAGPSFIFGFLPLVFSDVHRVWQIWLIHIGSAVLSGMILCNSQRQVSHQVTMNNAPVMSTAVRSMAMICGWVTIFRVLICFLERWFFRKLPTWISAVLIGGLELTNGCISLQKIPDESLRFVLCAGMLSFGGLCVHMQTMSILQGLSAKKYWEGKMLQTFFSLLIACATVYAGHWYALAGMGIMVTLILIMQKRLAIPKKMVYNAHSISGRKSPCYFAKKSSAPAAIAPTEPNWRKA